MVSNSSQTLVDRELRDTLTRSILSSADGDDLQYQIDNILETRSQQSDDAVNLSLCIKYIDLLESKNEAGSSISTNVPIFTTWRSSEFWIRFGVAVFAMTSFIIMCTAKLQKEQYRPQYELYSYCSYQNMSGSFNVSPYQSVIGIGVAVFVVNVLYIMYYLFPIGEDNARYIPGFKSLVSMFDTNGAHVPTEPLVDIQLSPGLKSCVAGCTNLMLDVAMLIVSALICIVASIMLERSAYYTFGQEVWYCGSCGCSNTYINEEMYFTIASFFETFKGSCIDHDDNPVHKIRTSLAMMYIAVGLLAINIVVSFRKAKKQRNANNNIPVLTKEATFEDGQSSHAIESVNPISTTDKVALKNVLIGGIQKLGSKGVQREIDDIIIQGAIQENPESSINLMLLNKFNELIAFKRTVSEGNNIVEIPEQEEKYVTWRNSLFWMRLLCAILSMVSFIVMSTASVIGYDNYKPQDFFGSCNFFTVYGMFNARPYHAVVAAGATIFAVNVLYVIYYLLPVNEENEKYLPGWKQLMEFIQQYSEDIWITINEPICSIQCSPRLKSCLSSCSEVFLDVLLFIFCAISCIVASIVLERSAYFSVQKHDTASVYCSSTRSYLYQNINVPESAYFTIATFFDTFTQHIELQYGATFPPCLSWRKNPVSKIRSSLGALYVALWLLAVITLRDYRKFQKRPKFGTAADNSRAPKEDHLVKEGLLNNQEDNDSGSGKFSVDNDDKA